jgi:hypothetical protein
MFGIAPLGCRFDGILHCSITHEAVAPGVAATRLGNRNGKARSGRFERGDVGEAELSDLAPGIRTP